MSKTVQLVGFDVFPEDLKKQINVVSNRLLDKYKKMFGEESLKMFKLAVDKKRERGEHTLFEIKGSLSTSHGLFYAVHSDWKILDATEKVIKELERQMTSKKEKMKTGKK